MIDGIITLMVKRRLSKNNKEKNNQLLKSKEINSEIKNAKEQWMREKSKNWKGDAT